MQDGSMASITIRDLPTDVHTELKVLCVRRGVTMNSVIVQVLADYVNEQGRLPSP